jgi:hypothetical protein
VIRLVHQFDEPRTRATVAAPKSSGMCCCCCCCVVTLLSSSIVTARAVGRVAPSGAPVPALSPEDAAVVTLRPTFWWKALGFFLLPLAILVGILFGQADMKLGIAAFVSAYLVGLFVLRTQAGLSGKWIGALVFGIPLLVPLEVWITVTFFMR